MRWLARAIRVTPVAKRAKGNMRLELWGASRKSALLADVAGLQVEVVSPTGVVIQEVTGNR